MTLSTTSPGDEREASTPSSRWHAAGEPDPHAGHYDKERSDLMLGDLTDDELANGAFMNYNERLSVADMLNPKPGQHMPIVWMTAVKERIRWLSRALERSLSSSTVQQVGAEQLDFYVVPSGWKLVPTFPTKEMIDAGHMHTMRADEEEPYRARGEAIACYADMLAAAPSPKSEQGDQQ